MGQPIVVIEKPSSNRGVVRFETNRALTGMGHERYRSMEDAWGPRPPDVLARRLFEHGGVDGVHVNSNVVTVDLSRGHTSEGLREVIEGLYRFYPGTDGTAPQHPVDVAEGDAAAGAAPELTSDPGAVAAPEVRAEEAPGRGGVEDADGPTEAPMATPPPPDAAEAGSPPSGESDAGRREEADADAGGSGATAVTPPTPADKATPSQS